MRTRTQTILFSDVVASTQHLSETGDRPDAFRHAFFAVMRKAVTAHHGKEVKSLGDGLMVVFDSTVDGVAAAVAMQQAVWRHRPLGNAVPLRVRVGLSVGEVSCEHDDYFGVAVVEAARLCAAAGAGQILASGLVRALACRRSEHAFEDLGPMSLRGLPDPVETTEVHWTPEAELALPSALVAAGSGPFVGRQAGLATFATARERAVRGERRTLMVAGEPGIGKTRLVATAAAAAHAAGTTVVYGRCDRDLGVAYQPFAEALRHYVRGCHPDTLAAHVAAHGGELGRLVPELHQRLASAPAPAVGDPEGARLRLFEAVDSLLALASREAPMLVVIDDLHWADQPTLLLLAHLARSLEPSATLFVATYRDTDIDRTSALTDTLADLSRCSGVDRIRLRGLDGTEVRELLVRTAGRELDSQALGVANRVHAETRGNPFFVAEVLRHLVETRAVYQRDGAWRSDLAPDELGIPDSVLDVVRGRLSRLSAAANRVLAVASVVGADFSAELLERSGCAGPAAEVVDGLDEALRAELIESDHAGARGYTFAHAIVRQAISRDLTIARLRLLHEAVGTAIEAMPGSDNHQRIVALAHHFAEAAPNGHWAKAADYALAAAHDAIGQVALEEAASLLERGLRALETAERPDLARQCDLLLALSQVRVRALDLPGIHDATVAAARVARAMGSPERLAEAAYWYSARCVAGERDEVGIAMGEEALAGMGEAAPVARARALAVLAQLRSFAGDSAIGDTLSREALVLARDSCDPVAAALAMNARYHSLWGSERVAEQLALGEQLLECQVVMPSGWLASVDARRLVALARLALGDLAGFAEDTAELERLGGELKSRYFLSLASLWKTCSALVEGRLTDVMANVRTTKRLIGEDRNFNNGVVAQLFYLSFEQGTLAELQATVVDVVEATPGLVAFRAALALSSLEVGDRDRAQEILDAMSAHGCAAVPRDLVWPGAMSLLCEVCAGLGDARVADVLYRLFRSHAGLLVVTANALHCPGPVDRYLGMLAATAGRHGDAEAHYRAALELERRMQAPPLEARTRLWYARMLIDRGERGDHHAADAMLERAVQIAQDLGMRRILHQADHLSKLRPSRV